MKQHCRNGADEAKNTLLAGRTLGARDPTSSSPSVATRVRLNSSAVTTPKTVKRRSRNLDWDTIVIWLFLVVLAVISLLTVYQFWAKLHPH